MNEGELWHRLNDAAHLMDRPLPIEWRSMYEILHRTVRRLKPDSIIEIGVRAGYSSLLMLDACENARILGIDADNGQHGGQHGFWEHALDILPAERFSLMLVDSQQIQRLPASDLVYIDGDHTFGGCTHDLHLASETSPVILIDDYDTVAIPGVKKAVLGFLEQHPDWTGRHIPNGLTGLYLLRKETADESETLWD